MSGWLARGSGGKDPVKLGEKIAACYPTSMLLWAVLGTLLANSQRGKQEVITPTGVLSTAPGRPEHLPKNPRGPTARPTLTTTTANRRLSSHLGSKSPFDQHHPYRAWPLRATESMEWELPTSSSKAVRGWASLPWRALRLQETNQRSILQKVGASRRRNGSSHW